MFITPIASVSNKLWPEPFWQVVINSLVQSGFEIVIPWWSQAEKERGLRLQNNHPKIHLLPQFRSQTQSERIDSRKRCYQSRYRIGPLSGRIKYSKYLFIWAR